MNTADHYYNIDNTKSFSNFHSDLKKSRLEEHLVDVTIVCESRKLYAHRIVLSLGSKFFKAILNEHPCGNSIIVLKNIKYDDMSSILDILYVGDAKVKASQLKSFIDTGVFLKVRGFASLLPYLKDDGVDLPNLLAACSAVHQCSNAMQQRSETVDMPIFSEIVPLQLYQIKSYQTTINDKCVVAASTPHSADDTSNDSANLSPGSSVIQHANYAQSIVPIIDSESEYGDNQPSEFPYYAGVGSDGTPARSPSMQWTTTE
uniref:BTB domain-containing protein n=1 Tax=Anopheles stephensi TaxID=30069 RepID=A0A182XVD8_ANOST